MEMAMDSPSELFLKYHYAEGKDLLKTFLTLLSATLVVSIAFAEKIIDFRNSGRLAKGYLMTCWMFLITAIIFCGLSICSNSFAGGAALSDLYIKATETNPEVFSWVSYSINFALLAGGAFICGLIAMILAAMQSMWKR